MRQSILGALFFCLAVASPATSADDQPVFSGPQVGEKLAPFNILGVFGDHAGQTLDFVKANEDRPQVLIFVHELTRPSIATANAVMNYVGTRRTDGLVGALIFLGKDLTEVEARLNRAKHALTKDALIGISTDGQEGPGSYGLNRNMTLTVLVAHEGKVTANFAIVQPTPAVDVPKIVAAITQLIGGEVPSLAQLGVGRYGATGRAAMRNAAGGRDLPADVQVRLRRLIRPTTTEEDVKRLAEEIETITQDDPKSRAIIGTVSGRVQQANYFSNITPPAQAVIRDWAQRFATEVDATQREESGSKENGGQRP